MVKVRILSRTPDEKSMYAQAVFYFSVPATNNAEGIPWRTVMKEINAKVDEYGVPLPVKPLHPRTTPEELVAITNGELIQLDVGSLWLGSVNLTDAEMAAKILETYEARKTEEYQKMLVQYNWYGHEMEG